MIMIALIVLPLASVSAQCSHDPYYWNEDFVYFYEYGDDLLVSRQQYVNMNVEYVERCGQL